MHTPQHPAICIFNEALIANKPENIAHKCSSNKESHKQKNDLNKRGEYPEFDEVSNHMREAVIKLYAEKRERKKESIVLEETAGLVFGDDDNYDEYSE